jgi:hypothetical protein
VTNFPPPPPAPGEQPPWQPPAAPYLPPGPPAHGAPGPGHGQPPPKKGRGGLVAVIAVLAVLALCCGGGVVAVLALRPTADAGSAEQFAESIGELKAGDCVRHGELAGRYRGVSCASKDNIGTVSTVFPGTAENGQDCPADTDLVLVESGAIACARSSTAERAGEPGKGGGVIVAGDCLGGDGGATSLRYREVPCTDPTVYEKVSGRADSTTACTPPAVRFVELDDATVRRIVCLADVSGGVAGVGECIGEVSSLSSLVAVPCGTPAAGGTVLARRATGTACGAVPGMTHWFEDESGLPATRYLCVRKI